MSDVVIRGAVAGDLDFLEDMLFEAAYSPRQNRSRAETLADPAIAHYVDGWPRPTDTGVVAVDEHDRPVGAAWLRFFTEQDPGYGFVRADIPELSIGVVADRRGQGVGRTLLRALAQAARQRGLDQLSLSVERTNSAAAALYRSAGYRVVTRREHADTMLLDLRPDPADN